MTEKVLNLQNRHFGNFFFFFQNSLNLINLTTQIQKKKKQNTKRSMKKDVHSAELVLTRSKKNSCSTPISTRAGIADQVSHADGGRGQRLLYDFLSKGNL